MNRRRDRRFAPDQVKGPLVSAIVPAYNHERFVDEALASLVRQSYEQLELIVVDDGSSDQTFTRVQALLSELERRFPRVEIVRQPHLGIGPTIESCLRRVGSDFVYMLDSDDIAAPHAVETLLPLLEPADVALALGDNDFIDEAGDATFPIRGEQSFDSFLSYHTAARPFDVLRDFGTYRSLIAGNYVPNGWLFRLGAVQAVGGYAPGFLLDDWELLLRLVKRYRVALTTQLLLHYRLHAGNTNRLQRHRMLHDTVRLLLREHAFSAQQGYLDEWYGHANQVLCQLSPEDFEHSPLLEELFPTLQAHDLSALRTFTTSLAASHAESIRSAAPALEKTGAAPRTLPRDSARQRIHLYATCWNDVRMLPFFFRHYDPFVERYVICDDGSDDGSIDLLRAHARVDLRRFEWTHSDSFVLSELDHYNSCWKESRGHADWVIVCDVDEHLHVNDLGDYLKACRDRGVTVLPARGYEMVTEHFPDPDEILAVTRRRGAPADEMSKLAVFQPDAIEELNHAAGGHQSKPIGRVVAPARDELLLLHYKYLGLDYVMNRDARLRTRLRETDLARGWARHWADGPAEVQVVLERLRRERVDVSAVRPLAEPFAEAHTWWRNTLPRLADLEQLGELERDRTHLASALEALQGELTATIGEAARLQRERTEAEAAVAASQARVEAIEASKTWRWSRPIRSVVDVVVRLLGSTSVDRMDVER